jgi:hypothetical protein
MIQAREDQAHMIHTIDLKVTVAHQLQDHLAEVQDTKEQQVLLHPIQTRTQDHQAAAGHMSHRGQEATTVVVVLIVDQVTIREVLQEVLLQVAHLLAVARHRQVHHQVLHLVADLREARDNNI